MVTISSRNGKSGLFTGIIFLVVGLVVATWGGMEILKAKASQNWPTVDGRVTHSEVDQHRETSTNNNSSRRETKYTANIHYTYDYEGASYTGKRVCFGGSRKGSSSMANQIVNRFPLGKTVEVYVDPAKPATACLEPGVTAMAYIPLGIGVIFAVVGLGITVAGFVARK
ncbi:MAG: DUF3592 domain-containing protein [Lentisphaeria bacterium]|nr:DUF3592 domain-containing protein [Lentisphaeria bacterium]